MNDREVAEKIACNAAYVTQGPMGRGASKTSSNCAESARECMSDSMRTRLSRAQRESRKAEQLSELIYLLDKNPEIARILDLVDAVGRDY